MAAERTITLERWDAGGYEEREIRPASAEVLRETFGSVSGESCATVAIDSAGRSLLINIDRERYGVTALLGDDDFYNLVGDPSAQGTTLVAIGGQEADFPRRYLVTREQALSSALDFLDSGNVDTRTGSWDRQGPADAWGE